MWCIPPKQNAEFVAHMEDVLEVYSRPYNEKRPVICMDEKPFQLLDEMYTPISMSENNHSKKYDCEYIRKGSCSIFMFTEPLGQWREAHALPHRTCEDWARQMKWLIDDVYSDAEKIVLVMDNLNTHNVASFYKAFSPEEAFRLTQKLEIHYTPKTMPDGTQSASANRQPLRCWPSPSVGAVLCVERSFPGSMIWPPGNGRY